MNISNSSTPIPGSAMPRLSAELLDGLDPMMVANAGLVPPDGRIKDVKGSFDGSDYYFIAVAACIGLTLLVIGAIRLYRRIKLERRAQASARKNGGLAMSEMLAMEEIDLEDLEQRVRRGELRLQQDVVDSDEEEGNIMKNTELTPTNSSRYKL